MRLRRRISVSEEQAAQTESQREQLIVQSEAIWTEQAEQCEVADLVFVCEASVVKNEKLVDVCQRLKQAGVRIKRIKSPSGKRIFMLLTAVSLGRMEQEADRRRMAMKLAPHPNDRVGSRPKGAAFVRAFRAKFMLKGNRLFSPMERQRIMMNIAEGAQFRGCAEIDIDELIDEKLLLGAFALHTAERSALAAAWLGVRTGIGKTQWPHGWPYAGEYATAEGKWPLRHSKSRETRRILPDLGLIQQPVDAIRSYFGSQIAFYFAWVETYTCWLLSVMWVGVVGWLGSVAGGDELDSIIIPLYSIMLALSIAVFNKFWDRRRIELVRAATLPSAASR